MNETNWKAAYHSMRSKMLAERKARLAWERVAEQRRADHDAACNRHTEAATKLQAAKYALNDADTMLCSCRATLITYATVMRNPNQSIAYQLGENSGPLIRSIETTRETINKATA